MSSIFFQNHFFPIFSKHNGTKFKSHFCFKFDTKFLGDEYFFNRGYVRTIVMRFFKGATVLNSEWSQMLGELKNTTNAASFNEVDRWTEYQFIQVNFAAERGWFTWSTHPWSIRSDTRRNQKRSDAWTTGFLNNGGVWGPISEACWRFEYWCLWGFL